MSEGLPRRADLDPATAARARIVVLHAPTAADGATTWLLSLVDLAGVVVARETVRDHGTPPLAALVQARLDALGWGIDGDWISDTDAHAAPRHRALLR